MTFLRILIVTEDIPYPSLGGLAKHALTLARALVRAGHKVDVLGGDQHPIEVAGEEGLFGGRFFGELHGHLARWGERRLGVFLLPRKRWVARRFARRIMSRASDYDVIHYHGHFPNVGRYIPAHVNFVQTRHDQGGDCIINTRFRNGDVCTLLKPEDCAGCITSRPNIIQRTLSAIAVKKHRHDVAQAFQRHKTIFVSDMLRKNFARVAGSGRWGTVVHNFVDSEKFRPVLASAQNPVRASEGKRVAFAAGKLYPPKGFGSLLKTLTPKIPDDMQLIVAGDGPEEEGLRKNYESKSVKFVGWLSPSEILQFTSTADFVVVPSIWEEPCSTTIFEGLLLGKPTFALARGGTAELAIYAKYGEQLRLHTDMESLVSDLVDFRLGVSFPPEFDGRGCVDQALPRLLAIYRAPPGPLSDQVIEDSKS